MKKKRITALLLTAAMIGTCVPYGTLTVRAKEMLKPAGEIKADVNKTKFTHKEWKGTDYKNVDGKRVTGEDVFGINREDAGVSIIPYQDTASAASAVWDYNARENSEYFQLLTGKNQKWDLTVVQNQKRAQKFMGKNGFMTKDYKKQEADGWKSVELPKSWTRDDFDFSIYTNMLMPWQAKYDPFVLPPNAPTNYNPVGLYRKTFTVDDKMLNDGRRVYLNFAGVESAYYVYVNGKEVGYSEDSYSPHHFDVTDYLQKGENILAVKVHKFCDGTWFEDQDMIYDGGIFRDVYLTSAPLMQIKDYTVRTDLDSSYKNVTLEISADIRNLSDAAQSGYKIQAKALDKDGNDILGGVSVPVEEVVSTKTKTVELKTKVANPKLWSAENPNLYALVLTLIDESGNEVETVSTQLGFREIEFTRTEVDKNYNVTTKEWEPIKINGKRLLMKGANRHDTDPFYGKAVPQKTMLEDVKLMKQNNLNAVRTSHYSNDDYFYWLCNSYGLYMIGETNLESHNLMHNNPAKALFYELTMDRTETAYKRLKNNPAIVIWSIGNEMVYTSDPNASKGMFRDMIWYFKNNDPTRPVHSEGQNDKMGTDMGSNMYPDVPTTQGRAGEGKIPYVLCEYAHGMGNSIGNLKEYWDAIRSADNMLGAFVWDWVDQSRVVDLDTLDDKDKATDGKENAGKWDYYATENAHKNLYADEIKGKFYGYGGDWGDFPNDNSFCENGLLSPDRNPQPELMEVKYQYQNFWFSAEVSDLDARQVNVYNESNFKNLNEYDVTWQLIENGKEIQSGKVENTDVAPQTTGKIKVPFTMPEQISAGNEYYLNLSVSLKEDTKWAEKGAEMAWAQIAVPVSVKQSVPQISDKDVTVNETDKAFEIKGDKFAFSIDKSTGTMNNYTYNGETLVQQGPVPNFWRGLVENDRHSFDRRWKDAAKNIKVQSVKATKNEAGQNVITANIIFPNANLTKETIVYTINGSGEVTIKMSVDARNKGMGRFIRVGSMMTLPEGFENVTWYGNGPVETFNDRKTNARQGIYTSTVSDFFYPYLKVDDTGNLTDVKWISVKSDKSDTALLISAKDKVEASALHFTPDDLNAVKHVYGLTPRKETILSVNYGSLGTGGATCGPGPLAQYQLPSGKVYEWEFTMIPTDKNANEETLGNMAKSYHEVSSFDRENYDEEYAQSLMERIDSFVVYDYSQLEEVERLQADVKAMTKEQAAIVNKDKDRSKLVEGYVKEVKALENKETYIQDSSKNALEIPYESSAKFEKNGETIVMNGKLAVPFNEVLDPVLEGNKSFTVEAKVTPTGSLDYNMFAGKGDEAFALRSRTGSHIDFHIYAGGKWRSIEYKMTKEQKANWLGKEHQIVGVYDDANHKIRLYVDGELMKEARTNTKEGVAHSDYNFTIGGCPSTDRTSAADFSSVRVYQKALAAEEVAAQNSDKPAIEAKDENVALWVDMKDIKHREKENIYKVTIDPIKAAVEVGNSKEFTLVPDNANAKLTNVKWSVVDEKGFEAEEIQVQYSTDDYAKATVVVSENAAPGNYVLKAENINGKKELKTEAQFTVMPKPEPTVFDSSKNKLDTLLPNTAQFTEGETTEAGALKGYFSVDDKNKVVNDAISENNAFTVSSRVYVPASVKGNNTGVWDKEYPNEKHTMIASMGDNSFAYRIYYDKKRRDVHIDAFISDGESWLQATTKRLSHNFFNKWHTISASYDGKTLKVYVDNEVTEKVGTMSVHKSENTFSVGYEPQKEGRQSELTFEQVRVFNQALNADQLNKATDPNAENVVLWLDFDAEGNAATETEKLNLQYLADECEQLQKDDCFNIGWNEMQTALNAAKEVLQKADPTKEEVQNAYDTLKDAKDKLVYIKDLKDAVANTKAEVENKDSYTKKSYEAFEKALNKAKEVLENQDATQKEVNDVKVTLLDAQNKLVKKADVTALKEAIDKSEKIKEEDVTPSSWDRVQAAKKVAEDVLKAFEKDNESVTQAQIDSVANRLKEVIDSVQKRTDFSELQEAVNRIEKSDLDGYTKDSIKILKEALKEAKAVLKKEDATKKEVEDALTKLLATEEGLVKENEKPNPDTKSR